MTHAERAKRRAEIVAAFRAGETTEAVAVRFGMSPAYLDDIRLAMNAQPRPAKCRAPVEPLARIIEALRRRQETYAAIGERFGISRQRVHQIAVEAGLTRKAVQK